MSNLIYLDDVVGAPPDGWHLGFVKLRLRNPDGRQIVECWERGAFAVHALEYGGKSYARLSHQPTGLEISTFTTMDDAAVAAELIEPFADWSAIETAIPLGSDLYARIRDAWAGRWHRENAVSWDEGCLMVHSPRPSPTTQESGG